MTVKMEKFGESRVLIVDDDKEYVDLLSRFLGKIGITHIQSVTDSRNVLRAVRKEKPDLVLLDIRMPYPDGLSLMDDLSEYIEGGFFKVLVVTGEANDTIRRRALSLGALGILTKPFGLQEFLDAVRKALSFPSRRGVPIEGGARSNSEKLKFTKTKTYG